MAAAADLTFALKEVIREFERQNPEMKVVPTFGSSGNFFAQISSGAPFDLFLSADIEYPRRLAEQKLADPESEFLYALGHLVLWVRNDSPLDPGRDGIDILTDGQVSKVAIANPAFAPYGRAAVSALKALNVYESIEPRLVLGENVSQAAQFVESGAADAGIIALSLAVAPALRDKGRFWEVPLDAHPPLEQGGIVLTTVREREVADAFRAFLTSDAGRMILRKFGFLLPGE